MSGDGDYLEAMWLLLPYAAVTTRLFCAVLPDGNQPPVLDQPAVIGA
jgi:hypothetical protein